jgi:hypothetical protein
VEVGPVDHSKARYAGHQKFLDDFLAPPEAKDAQQPNAPPATTAPSPVVVMVEEDPPVDPAVSALAKARQQLGLPVVEITAYYKLYPAPAVATQEPPAPEVLVDKACMNDTGTQAAAALKSASTLKAVIKMLEEADPTNGQLTALKKDLAQKEMTAAKVGTKSTAAQSLKTLREAEVECGKQQDALDEVWSKARQKSSDTLQSHMAIADRYLEYFTNFKSQAKVAHAEMQEKHDVIHRAKRAHHGECMQIFKERITKAEASIAPAASATSTAMEVTLAAPTWLASLPAGVGTSMLSTEDIFDEANVTDLPVITPTEDPLAKAQLADCGHLHGLLRCWTQGGQLPVTFGELRAYSTAGPEAHILVEKLLGEKLWKGWFDIIGKIPEDSDPIPRQALTYVTIALDNLKTKY